MPKFSKRSLSISSQKGSAGLLLAVSGALVISSLLAVVSLGNAALHRSTQLNIGQSMAEQLNRNAIEIVEKMFQNRTLKYHPATNSWTLASLPPASAHFTPFGATACSVPPNQPSGRFHCLLDTTVNEYYVEVPTCNPLVLDETLRNNLFKADPSFPDFNGPGAANAECVPTGSSTQYAAFGAVVPGTTFRKVFTRVYLKAAPTAAFKVRVGAVTQVPAGLGKLVGYATEARLDYYDPATSTYAPTPFTPCPPGGGSPTPGSPGTMPTSPVPGPGGPIVKGPPGPGATPQCTMWLHEKTGNPEWAAIFFEGSLPFPNGGNDDVILPYMSKKVWLGHANQISSVSLSFPNATPGQPPWTLTAPMGQCHVHTTSYSPLIVSLDGKKARFGAPEKGPRFDMTGNGRRYHYSWPVRPEATPFLVQLRDGRTGVQNIDDMFGDGTRGPNGYKALDGFAALRKYDDNGDNVIDARDAIFSRLRLWLDKNRDGKSTPDELVTLSAKGIKAIRLVAKRVTAGKDAFGNDLRLVSQIVMYGGETRPIFDAWLTHKAEIQMLQARR